MKTRAFRAVRLAWVLVAATMVVLVVVKGENAETPSVVLALMSYPASFVAQFFASLPVKVEGLPDPSLILVPLATTALGFAQWFALVPWIADKVMAWHRDTPVTRTDVSRGNVASVIILLVTWSIAEIAAIALSISLNPVTHKVVRHLGAVVFHLWLAIPMALAAAAAAVAIARLFYSRDTTFWIIPSRLCSCAGAQSMRRRFFLVLDQARITSAAIRLLEMRGTGDMVETATI